MLIDCVTVSKFEGMSSWVEPKTKQKIKCLAQWYDTVPLLSLELATLSSQAYHSTNRATAPLIFPRYSTLYMYTFELWPTEEAQGHNFCAHLVLLFMGYILNASLTTFAANNAKKRIGIYILVN